MEPAVQLQERPSLNHLPNAVLDRIVAYLPSDKDKYVLRQVNKQFWQLISALHVHSLVLKDGFWESQVWDLAARFPSLIMLDLSKLDAARAVRSRAHLVHLLWDLQRLPKLRKLIVSSELLGELAVVLGRYIHEQGSTVIRHPFTNLLLPIHLGGLLRLQHFVITGAKETGKKCVDEASYVPGGALSYDPHPLGPGAQNSACVLLNLEALPEELSTLTINNAKLIALPSGVTALSRLTFLDLAGNLLQMLPDVFRSLSHLELLNLSRNLLTELPNSIGSLSNLQVLNLKHNRFTAMPAKVRERLLIKPRLVHGAVVLLCVYACAGCSRAILRRLSPRLGCAARPPSVRELMPCCTPASQHAFLVAAFTGLSMRSAHAYMQAAMETVGLVTAAYSSGARRMCCIAVALPRSPAVIFDFYTFALRRLRFHSL